MTEEANRTNERDAFDELLEAVNRPVESWDREREPAIAGKVVSVGTMDTAYGQCPSVSIVTKDDRELQIVAVHTVLASEIGSADVHVDDLLAVKYLGEQTGKNGGHYHGFKVVHRPAQRRPVDADVDDDAQPHLFAPF
jgi:hypothetical protein